MGYIEPEKIYIFIDSQNRPVLQVPEEDLPTYLKEKKEREEEKNQKPTS